MMNNIKHIDATITFTMKESNPDFKYVNDTLKVLTINDIYTMDEETFYSTEDINDYIKNDLSCIANGGYDYGEKHINIIKYEIKECK